jgi:hypothetical protein
MAESLAKATQLSSLAELGGLLGEGGGQ